MSEPARVRIERGLYKRGKVYFACATPEGERSPQWKSLGKVNLAEARRLRDEWVARVKGRKVARSKATFGTVAVEWIAEQQTLVGIELRRSTYVRYEGSLRLHVTPHFGQRRIGSVEPGDLIAWHRRQKAKGLSDWSIRNHWMALRLVLGYAVRHGHIPANPADALTKREKPKPGPNRLRFLDGDEIEALLNAVADRYCVAIKLAVFLGVRLGELRGLRWQEVDLANRVVQVTGQCDARGIRAEYGKTRAARREIVLMDALAADLRRAKLCSAFSRPGDFVIASDTGTAMNPRNLAQRGLEKGAEDAGLERVTFHVLRHTFASILIGQNHNPLYVAAQMGHEKPSVTLDTYGHLFNRAKNAERHRKGLDDDFGHLFGQA